MDGAFSGTRRRFLTVSNGGRTRVSWWSDGAADASDRLHPAMRRLRKGGGGRGERREGRDGAPCQFGRVEPQRGRVAWAVYALRPQGRGSGQDSADAPGKPLRLVTRA